MIRREDGSLREELMQMWTRIFHDTLPYTEYYFNEVYGHNEILLEEDEGTLRGMLHLNPYRLMMGQDTLDAHYIVGVSTEEEYRRQGVMRNLLKESFQTLRSRGEAFTYLMPADEAYYLPFDFQFGMVQHEQEIEPGQWPVVDKGYTFHLPTEVDLEEFARLENEQKRECYAIATEVSQAYFERIYEEVRSEFGCFFYIKKDGKPAGRFVVYAEDDFLAISQLACYDPEAREELLSQIIQFCDQRYHFRSYRITYPEDWKKNLLVSEQFGQMRVFQTRTKPIIMFRILDLSKMAAYLRSEEEVDVLLHVVDTQIPEQDGIYRFVGSKDGMSITKLDAAEEMEIYGEVSIASLTARIFGNLDGAATQPEGLKEAGEKLWKSMVAIQPIEIPEIV